MALNKIKKDSITGDAIDATKIADDAISEEHLDDTVITGNTLLDEVRADTPDKKFVPVKVKVWFPVPSPSCTVVGETLESVAIIAPKFDALIFLKVLALVS